MWFAGFVLSCVSVSAAVAVDTIPLREPTPGPHEFYKSAGQAVPRPQVQSLVSPAGPAPQQISQTQQESRVPQGKTREEVKRELAAARAAGCMDVSDSQYPQPCPPRGVTRMTADAFQTE
ncbi:DUF4148 domain-containing protein [Paraburkholderia caffeinilytica]|uniref:DUF4148 domain-containing protein n=1 Tax=Paraburkholderia caffeinilytica TaxID=1761016 RepID=UPI0038BDE248